MNFLQERRKTFLWSNLVRSGKLSLIFHFNRSNLWWLFNDMQTEIYDLLFQTKIFISNRATVYKELSLYSSLGPQERNFSHFTINKTSDWTNPCYDIKNGWILDVYYIFSGILGKSKDFLSSLDSKGQRTSWKNIQL